MKIEKAKRKTRNGKKGNVKVYVQHSKLCLWGKTS